MPRQAAFIVYINGIEVPAKSVNLRFGVWQMPEMQIEMTADPVLARLGAEDRVQVAVFYLDDCDVVPGVKPEFRLFGEGEITGWGYRNTGSGRSISFTVVNQVAIYTQLTVHFLNSFEDLVGDSTNPAQGVTNLSTPSSSLVYPLALFTQGLLQTGDVKADFIKRPFDFLYNCVRGMIDARIPADHQTIPASNFFARWARLTNFHNRFAASPFFDDVAAGSDNIYPVLKAVQSVSAVSAIVKNLIPNVQNSGSIWDMLEMVNQTLLTEIAMIPSMPLVTVDLASSLIQATNFNEHILVQAPGYTDELLAVVGGQVRTFGGTAITGLANGHAVEIADGQPIDAVTKAPVKYSDTLESVSAKANARKWVPALSVDSRKMRPKRIPNYFVKPQSLFSIPPACNAVFPSQLLDMNYSENYATQPTRLYFNDGTINRLTHQVGTQYAQTVMDALAMGYPPEVDQDERLHPKTSRYHAKNFLLYAEEFFKGPVMDRRDIPPWMFFLSAQENNISTAPADGSIPTPPAPAQTNATPAPTSTAVQSRAMSAPAESVGSQAPDGSRRFKPRVEALRPKIQALCRKYSGVPEDLALAWIQKESGGWNGASDGGITTLNERGYFQIMGPHVDPKTKKYVPLANVEAARLGLTLADTGADYTSPVARLSTDPDFSLDAGFRLLVYYRKRATQTAITHGLAWTEGDMWRLTKAHHVGIGFYVGTTTFKGFIPIAKQLLGRAPVSWYEMYKTLEPTMGKQSYWKFITNATATGGVVPSATGSMTTVGDPVPVSARPGSPPPPTPQASTSTAPSPAPAPSPMPPPGNYDAVQLNNETVYKLYAKFEFFRERYAKRNGSASIAWNPYVVPGFPAVILDQRASRVDLYCYITTVQQSMSHDGRRGTQLSFSYGRQLQEMFQLLSDEFSLNDATARGSAPQEPIRDVSKVLQSFPQAETYYQGLFYGAQPLYGKDASFDFRSMLAYAPRVAGASPEPIYVDGPDAAVDDAVVQATQDYANLLAKRTPLNDQVVALQAQVNASTAVVAANNSSSNGIVSGQAGGSSRTLSLDPPTFNPPNQSTSEPEGPDAFISTVKQQQTAVAEAALNDQLKQLTIAKANLAALDSQINSALSIKDQTTIGSSTRVSHNLGGANANREVVPTPRSAQFFESRDAAMRYNWRPICTLDEYIVFLNSAGEGAVRAFGDPHSVGARYFERIRRIVYQDLPTTPPPGVTGLDSPSVTGMTQTSFSQSRSDWDVALRAYRNNVLAIKTPRT